MMKNQSIVIASALVAGLLLGVPSAPARADKCDDESGSGEKKPGKNFHIEYRNGQKITVIDTVVAVCGKVPRPSVVYVLQAKNINYEWENLKQDFLPLVLASIKTAPF